MKSASSPANLRSPAFSDFAWERCSQAERETLALAQARQTALFAKACVPFYSQHYATLSESNIADIACLEELALTLPTLTKDHLASSPVSAFLPKPGAVSLEVDKNNGRYRNFGTGGTTGRPVTILYSVQDWRAAMLHANRHILFDFDGDRSFFEGQRLAGLYHGDHITNQVYGSFFSDLGMDMLRRVSTKVDLHHNYQLIQEFAVNGLLGPPEDPTDRQTKGITLDKILEIDAVNEQPGVHRLNHRINPAFKMIFWSSMPMSLEFYRYLTEHLGIPYVKGHYGSTELCPTGATCRAHPLKFHLGYGPSLVLIRKPDAGRLAAEGEEGYLLVSKTGASCADGTSVIPSGTYILNYRTGDFGYLEHMHGQTCACGRNTPILNVYRKEMVELKKVFGCQAD